MTQQSPTPDRRITRELLERLRQQGAAPKFIAWAAKQYLDDEKQWVKRFLRSEVAA